MVVRLEAPSVPALMRGKETVSAPHLQAAWVKLLVHSGRVHLFIYLSFFFLFFFMASFNASALAPETDVSISLPHALVWVRTATILLAYSSFSVVSTTRRLH